MTHWENTSSSSARQALSAGLGSSVLSRLSLVFALGNLIAMILAVVGIVRLKPPQVSVDLLLWLVLYFTLAHRVLFAVFRCSMPGYAHLFCFTAAGVTSLYGAHPAAKARQAS